MFNGMLINFKRKLEIRKTLKVTNHTRYFWGNDLRDEQGLLILCICFLFFYMLADFKRKFQNLDESY